MSTRQQPRQTKTKQLLLDTFLKLTQTYPISKITIEMVANEAGIKRTAVYYHYHSIDELVKAALTKAGLYEFHNLLSAFSDSPDIPAVEQALMDHSEQLSHACIAAHLNRETGLLSEVANDMRICLGDALGLPDCGISSTDELSLQAISYGVIAAAAYCGEHSDNPAEDMRRFVMCAPILKYLHELKAKIAAQKEGAEQAGSC